MFEFVERNDFSRVLSFFFFFFVLFSDSKLGSTGSE